MSSLVRFLVKYHDSLETFGIRPPVESLELADDMAANLHSAIMHMANHNDVTFEEFLAQSWDNSQEY